MDVASIFDWFALESTHAAGETSDPIQREMWARLALMWATVAQSGVGAYRVHEEP
jgi:hypothetical protein